MTTKVAVIGAGAWGTTMASLLASRADTTVWAREPEVVDAINEHHENPLFVPGERLSPALRATGDLEQALGDADVALLAVPSR